MVANSRAKVRMYAVFEDRVRRLGVHTNAYKQFAGMRHVPVLTVVFTGNLLTRCNLNYFSFSDDEGIMETLEIDDMQMASVLEDKDDKVVPLELSPKLIDYQKNLLGERIRRDFDEEFWLSLQQKLKL